MATTNCTTLDPEHLIAVKELADETHRPLEEVKRLYAKNLERLSTDARITDYLLVLTCKNVREELRR